MKKIIISITSLAALLLLSTFVLAQAGGTIKGKLVNKATGEPVPFANVYVEYGDQLIGTTTDVDGNYTIKPVPAGVYTLTAKMMGWSTTELVGIKVYDETITFAEEMAIAEGIYITDVIITGDPLLEPGAPDVVKMKSKDVEKLPNKRSINGILKVMTTDVFVDEERDEIYFRGSRSGDAAYYIDGVRVDGSLAECPSMSIGTIMVYTGGVPAKYGDFTGGVVVIETMSYFDWMSQKESERLMNGGN
ncbi:MAG: hypothetical protein C0592_05490 [Marinilabiliales bacterium]|nr:MAG: hypothetical protein C0592_05490 [Marinilabiliales bacterium]